MESQAINYLWQMLGTTASLVVALVIVAILASWRLRAYYDKAKETYRKTNANTTNIESLKTDVTEIKSTLTNMSHAMVLMSSLLGNKYKPVLDMLSEKHSPRKLNEYGNIIYKEINGEQFVNDHKQELFQELERYNTSNPLDVENSAYLACVFLSTKECFNNIKNYIYNRESLTIKNSAGEEKKYDITLQDVCFVLSLPLRDMYLAEHPSILG